MLGFHWRIEHTLVDSVARKALNDLSESLYMFMPVFILYTALAALAKLGVGKALSGPKRRPAKREKRHSATNRWFAFGLPAQCCVTMHLCTAIHGNNLLSKPPIAASMDHQSILWRSPEPLVQRKCWIYAMESPGQIYLVFRHLHQRYRPFRTFTSLKNRDEMGNHWTASRHVSCFSQLSFNDWHQS